MTHGSNFNSPPAIEAFRHNDIDLFNPFDILVAGYYLDIMYDQLPSEAAQAQLASGVQQRDTQAARGLIATSKGRVATVARQFKGMGAENELLLEGSKALLSSAQTYRPGGGVEFADHAIVAIETRLAATTWQPLNHPPDASRVSPSERIRQYAIDLFPIAPDQLTKNLELLKSFDPFERQVLSRLYLRKNKLARELECSASDVQAVIDKAQAMIDPRPPTVTALALELCDRGVHYNIRRPIMPLIEFMSNDQLDLCRLLGLPDAEIAAIRGCTEEQVGSQVGHMRTKTGARTRTELALQARILDTGERR